ncbi:MAG: hypothetical protein M0P95_07155 [Sulfuritalea sp.]|jgi:hypothetical protein|nr:hypothetical protein [Sulfuritalea sp.]
MNETPVVSGNTAAATSTARTRQHRERLKADCTRLDITIGTDVAGKLKALANQRGWPRWRIVEEAIEALDAARKAR